MSTSVELFAGEVMVSASAGGGWRWRAFALLREAGGRPIDGIGSHAERGNGEYAVRGLVLDG